jgi:hypothetical protein
MATRKQEEKEDAIKRLREFVKPGDTIYTVLRHVSSSGMSRNIDLYQLTIEEGKIRKYWLTGLAARALGMRLAKNDHGIVVSGCGMDMGFHVVYSLSHVLFPKGFVPDRAGWTIGRNGEPADKIDPDGGYALSHEWL